MMKTAKYIDSLYKEWLSGSMPNTSHQELVQRIDEIIQDRIKKEQKK